MATYEHEERSGWLTFAAILMFARSDSSGSCRDQVKSDAGDLKDVDTSTLDSAWDDFKSAVDDVPDDASVSDALSDISQAADSLASTTKSTLTGPDCSSS